jgi:hypothetical protein
MFLLEPDSYANAGHLRSFKEDALIIELLVVIVLMGYLAPDISGQYIFLLNSMCGI